MMEVEEVCTHLKTSIDAGIDENEAAMRLARDGPNAFTPPKQTAGWILYLREMTGGFALLLWFASIASFISYAIEKDTRICKMFVTINNISSTN